MVNAHSKTTLREEPMLLISCFAVMQSCFVYRAIAIGTCVPVLRMADCLLDSVTEADTSGIPYFLVGHVGDGVS